MRFLIAGLGSIGRRHLRNLALLGERDIILYRTHRSTLPDEEVDGYPVETDLAAALALQPDAVIVSNPTALHMEVAVPAARAGCHLLLEKPVSHNMTHMSELQQALQRSGKQALVGYQFRFHPGLQQAKRLLQEGAVGKPLSVHAHWGEYLPEWHPWEDYRRAYSARPELGGGVALTLSHPLDYLRWLLGEVSGVWAMLGKPGELEMQVEDTAEIGLCFERGCLGSVHLDYNQRPTMHWFEIVGSRGTLRWDNTYGVLRCFMTDVDAWQSFAPPDGFERNTLFVDEMRHFIHVARGEELPVCSLEDGCRALNLALAAYESARCGRLVELSQQNEVTDG
jgi:predicted dehydrogenase